MFRKPITTCLLLLFISCNQNKTITKKINVKTESQTKEKCIFYVDNDLDTLKFNRYFKIIKNTLTDTIVIGQGVLAPREIGVIEYTKLGDRDDVVLAIEYENPPTDRICISSYRNKKSSGELILQLELAEE
jgi:hypothetical protein